MPVNAQNEKKKALCWCLLFFFIDSFSVLLFANTSVDFECSDKVWRRKKEKKATKELGKVLK